MMEGSTECVELILHIIMDRNDLKVISAQTQHTIKNLQGRSVRLDVLAMDDSGRQINIEIQREDKGAGSKRARYRFSPFTYMICEPSPNASFVSSTQRSTLYRQKGRNRSRQKRRCSECGAAYV